ncbi:MAG: YdeI/OmpD-associated family protein [Bacteroidota bacterium]
MRNTIEGMRDDGVPTFYAESPAAWRAWLLENHDQAESVWLIIYKKDSGTPSITYPEAVDGGLCFGWIDSKPNKRDDKSFFQYFSKRNPKSNWSRVNKEKIARMLDAGLMHESGLRMVDLAKETGTWTALDDVENLVIPDDLAAAFAEYEQATNFFAAFPRSVKRGILEWIFNAKRPATRQKRIAQTAEMASRNERANQYRKS